MAKNNKGLLLTALAAAGAGAYAFFRKEENREKAKQVAEDLKDKVDETIQTFMPEEETYEHDPRHSDLVEKEGNADPYDFRDTNMVSEGAQTSVQYSNEVVEEEAKEDEKKDENENKSSK